MSLPANRHLFTAQERSRGGKASPGKFKKGPDRRRHKFSVEECRRGGQESWRLFMVRFRLGYLPIPGILLDLAEKVIAGEPIFPDMRKEGRQRANA